MTTAQTASSNPTRGAGFATPTTASEALDSFDQNDLSALQFSKKSGVSYPTFISWDRKHREEENQQGGTSGSVSRIVVAGIGGGVSVQFSRQQVRPDIKMFVYTD
ncbi:MAG: hypothetical protein ACQCXQ_14265 [Verrucomicrobiales bacterium]|nr:hypothetical protein [Verrucomicrobiota bacterium JB025]